MMVRWWKYTQQSFPTRPMETFGSRRIASASCSMRFPQGRQIRYATNAPCRLLQNCRSPMALHFHASSRNVARASYFTNAQRVRQDDPYATLGLYWGATQTDIKTAFRQLASQLHPDVNTVDAPAVAVRKFQTLTAAYTTLTKKACPLTLDDSAWHWNVWFTSDQIAQQRTDVAGALKRRPIPPASDVHRPTLALGHPRGTGVVRSRPAEYLGASSPSSSVGTGQNKWVPRKPYVAWNNDAKSTVPHTPNPKEPLPER